MTNLEYIQHLLDEYRDYKISEDDILCIAEQEIMEELAEAIDEKISVLAPGKNGQRDKWDMFPAFRRQNSIIVLRRCALFMEQSTVEKWFRHEVEFLTYCAGFLENDSPERIIFHLQQEVQQFLERLPIQEQSCSITRGVNNIREQCKTTLEKVEVLSKIVENQLLERYDIRGVDGNLAGICQLFRMVGGHYAVNSYFHGVPMEDILANA